MSLLDRLFGKKPAPAPEARPLPPRPTAPAPPLCPGNPGQGWKGELEFEIGKRVWREPFDLVRIAADILMTRGLELTAYDSWIALGDFVLQPMLLSFRHEDDGSVRTSTTMNVRHPELLPDGLFEYQHSAGANGAESLKKGFEDWAKVDLPVLLDALRPEPEKRTVIKLEFPADAGRPARTRRVLLGGVASWAEHPAPTPAGEEHPFCACCLVTRNMDAFKPHIEADGSFGIRVYAARSADGTPMADCRVNGEDYEPGMESLRAYVATWPGAGVEYRKQYVFIHTIPPPEP